MSDQIRRDDPHDLISPRQVELLRLIGRGMTLKKAADRMGITRKTANDHKCQLMHRLDLHTREDVVTYARKAFPDLKSGK